MDAASSAEDFSGEVRGRVAAAVRHLRDAHKAPEPERRKNAFSDLAEIMYWLRKNCRRRDGTMDLNGQGREYKRIIREIRESAGEPGAPLDIPSKVSNAVAELLFDDPEISEETRTAYGFGAAPSHILAKQKYSAERSRGRAFQRSGLSENIQQLICDVERLELSQLDEASDAERERVVEALSRLETLVRERRDEIGEVF